MKRKSKDEVFVQKIVDNCSKLIGKTIVGVRLVDHPDYLEKQDIQCLNKYCVIITSDNEEFVIDAHTLWTNKSEFSEFINPKNWVHGKRK